MRDKPTAMRDRGSGRQCSADCAQPGCTNKYSERAQLPLFTVSHGAESDGCLAVHARSHFEELRMISGWTGGPFTLAESHFNEAIKVPTGSVELIKRASTQHHIAVAVIRSEERRVG